MPNEFTDFEKSLSEAPFGTQKVGANLQQNSPAERITLERKLYESYISLLGAKPFPGLRPRQGRPNAPKPSETSLFRKFRSFFGPIPGPFLQEEFLYNA